MTQSIIKSRDNKPVKWFVTPSRKDRSELERESPLAIGVKLRRLSFVMSSSHRSCIRWRGKLLKGEYS